MAIKQTAHIIKGLRKDLSDSKHPKEYAIDAKNIRITNREDSTLLSITNEKGTKEVTLDNPILGEYLGHTVINDILVLFTKDTDKYYIYKIIPNININIKLFEGKLSDESINHIEALGIYESKDIQKVYWVDGINQPRMINIANEALRTNHKEFDFIQELQLLETINVEKSYSSGSFNSGIIQYAFNYYNKNGQETNIVEVTPINYISYEDRGAAPNDYVSNSFKIIINNVDNNFDYLRLYSIHRTSLDAIPSVKLVTDLPTTEMYHPGITEVNININPDSAKLKFINNSDTKYRISIRGTDTEDYNTTCTIIEDGITITAAYGASLTNILHSDIVVNTLSELGISISVLEDTGLLFGNYTILTYTELNPKTKYLEYIDTGNTGETVDPVELLYKGGEYIIPKTLAQKDGTLFFGNIKLKNYSEDSELENILKEWRETAKFSWKNKVVTNNTPLSGYYPFKSSLNNSGIAGFQSRETYRLGVQFQNKTGKWSDPIYFGDKKVDINPKTEASNNLISYYTNIAELSIPIELVTWARKNNYVKIRPVVVFPQDNEREIIAQGVLCPTVFNAGKRANKTLTVQSSWFFRPVIPSIELSDYSNIDKGSYTEYRHGVALPRSNKRNAEIQNSIYDLDDAFSLLTNEDASDMYSHLYGVDSSIVTFHSPEIELGKINNINNCKLRVIGISSIEANASDINITLSSTSYDTINYGLNNYLKNTNIEDTDKGGSLVSGLLWKDGLFSQASNPPIPEMNIFYMIYPWQKEGNLNNLQVTERSYSTLKSKKISNLKFSYKNIYLDTNLDLELASSEIFNNSSTVRLSTPRNAVFNNNTLDYFTYKGNIDDILYWNNSAKFYYPRNTDVQVDISKGYPYWIGNSYNENITFIDDVLYSEQYVYSKENILMRYKSSPHAVFVFEHFKENSSYSIKNILPDFSEKDSSVALDLDGIISKSNSPQVSIGGVGLPDAYLWLAELYREVPNKFGGDDYKNNVWYPAGESMRLPLGYTEIEFTQGDTFFARFDSLKTYSDDLEATNSVTEIGSFMVETRINLDARYDRNRGKQSNLVMNPGNFNLFNNVYNQKNNFFNYRIIDKSIADNTEFPNTIVWSKQKFAGADVDVWTNINMASSLDLDGTKGELTKLASFKNEIFSFQPEAINHILFNSRIQVPTSDGVPIELTNAYKVDGARQLSSVGSSNPLAIKSTDRGIYYMDNITKGIYIFNGQQSESLSDKLGMNSWIKNKDIDYYKTYYDKINQDVYFSGDECLCFSEKLGEFESFFDYNDAEIFNVGSKTYAFKDSSIHELFAGEYNRFFDEEKAFWVAITHNENPFNDKTYNTLEFRADTYINDILVSESSLNKIKVWNEYQDTGEVALTFNRYIPANLKRKFRIWRANIPRDMSNKRDRIRNTWTNIMLKSECHTSGKTELHDLVVSYFM